MKTLLNPLFVVLLLSSTLLSAQSVDRRNFFESAATAKAFLKVIEGFDASSRLRNSDKTPDSTYVYERTDEDVLAHVGKLTYESDQSGRIKTVRQFEIMDGQWLETLRAELTYQAATNTVITTISALDEETMELAEFARDTERTRDDGQLLYHELALFFGFDYLPFDVTVVSYNDKDLADTILSSNFDFEIFDLLPTTRQTNLYNSANKVLTVTIESYNNETLEFNPSELIEYVSYDSNGSPVKITNSYWNTVTESWLPFINYDFLYTYDNAQRVTKQTTYTTYLGEDPEIDIEEFEYHNTWGEITVHTLSTMSNGILTPLSRETYDFDNKGNVVLETQISLEQNPEVIVGKQQHFFDGLTSSVGQEKKLVFDIRHANPSRAGDLVYITVETTKLVNLTAYDIQGRKAGGKTFQFAENFRLPALPPGIYILVLQADGFKPESRKILIK